MRNIAQAVEMMMPTRPPLTDRQQKVYDLIVEQVGLSGYPPTIREIGLHLGIRSTNGVADHLKALKRKGYLKQQGQKSRTWQPIGLPDAACAPTFRPQLRMVPLLGRVAAGEPILAVDDAEGEIGIDAAWLASGREIFALTVAGNSMIDDGIFDGDTIFVQRQDHAEMGDIVVVMIDNEATVKRFYPQGDVVRLQPANEDMQPIMLTAQQALQVRIVGTVKGVWRRL